MENGLGFEIKNDAVIFGLLIIILAVIFRTSSSSNRYLKKFYTYVPPLLLCYFIPGLLNWPLGLFSAEESQLYFVASRYLLPSSLVLFCLSIDLKGVFNLGPKALIMFFTATLGIVIGAPFALWISGMIFPEIKEAVTGEEIWRGLSTIAGSWICELKAQMRSCLATDTTIILAAWDLGYPHRINASDERIEKTMDVFRELDIRVLGPAHCTVERATHIIRERFPDRFLSVYAGSRIEF